MLRGIINFALEKLYHPLFGSSIHLNPLNTLLYSALLVLSTMLLISWINESDFSIDRNFFLSSTPLMVLIGSLLGLSSSGSTGLMAFRSPYIYFLATLSAASIVATSLELEKRDIFSLNSSIFSLSLAGVVVITAISMPDLRNFIELVLIAFSWSIPGYILLSRLAPELSKLEFFYPIFAHYLDATTTFVSVGSGLREKMFVGKYFINIFGPAGIFVLKTLVILPLVYYLFKNLEGDEKLYYLYFITALGVVISSRNLFLLS